MLRCMQAWQRVVGCTMGLVVLPALLVAQTNGTARDNESQAIKARQKAELLLAQGIMDNWRKAAGYLERAANLRDADDPTAIEERVLAAELYNASRWQYRSQVVLQAAADQALNQGRVLAAAEYLVKAAIIANDRHRVAEAWTLAHKADVLTRSPHLSQVEVASIRNRIVLLPTKLIADR